MQPSAWNDDRITAYVLGELSTSEVTQIEAEIRSNVDFATAVDEARNVTKQLTAMFAAESPMSLDAVKRQEIFETPAALSNPPVVLVETVSHGATRRYFALAASVLLLGTVATVFYRGSTLDRNALPQVAFAPKAMLENESIDQPVAHNDALNDKVAKDGLTRSLERDVVALDKQSRVGPAQVAMDTKMESIDASLLQLQMQSAPMAHAPMASAPMASAPEATSEALHRRASVPAKNLSESMAIDAVGDNGRVGDLATDAEQSKFKQKEAALRQELSKKSAGKEVDEAFSTFGLNPTVPQASSAKPSGTSSELMLGDRDVAKSELSDLPASRPLPREGRSAAIEDPVNASDFDSSINAPMVPTTDGSSSVAGTMMGDFFGQTPGPAQPLTSSLADDLSVIDGRQYQSDPELGVNIVGDEKLDRQRVLSSSNDRFERIDENDFKRVNEEPLSTFSIDVDTASYSKVRQFILEANTVPPAGAVRIEELVNYFDYSYEPPAASDEHPFASRVEVASCPWKPEHRLARIAIKGKVIENAARPQSNLVFLVDTSGSMEEPNKLPLVKQGLQKLVGRLSERDRVAIVVYAGSAGLVLDSTPANDQSTILRKINQMQSGGSTNGGQGIRLAYQVARDHFIKDGVNRVILCSDGDFNVGTTSDDELVGLIETESKGGIDLTVLGFGIGNHNDSMMEKISGRGNGNYAFIDSASEANRVLVEQTSGTLVTIARDVKIQVEFNPSEVAAYRLIGYENRKLANEDFKDDTKDAGEIGAGHTVTALYELIPVSGDLAVLAPAIDELRYQKEATLLPPSKSGELMTVKLRYKKPDSDTSIPISFPATDGKRSFDDATEDFRFAVAVAGFGMLLRSSEHAGNWTMSNVQQAAEASKASDPHGLRTEFVEIVRRACQLIVKE